MNNIEILITVILLMVMLIIYLMYSVINEIYKFNELSSYYMDLNYKNLFTSDNMGLGVPIYCNNDGWLVKSMKFNNIKFPILKVYLYEPQYDNKKYEINDVWPQFLTPTSFYFKTNKNIQDLPELLSKIPDIENTANIFNLSNLPYMTMIQPIEQDVADFEQLLLLKKCMHDRVIWGETPKEAFEYCLLN